MKGGLGFSPHDGDVEEAATLLAKGGGKWEQLWQRFSEAPKSYAGVTAALRKATHSFLTTDRDPGHNEKLEGNLRRELEALFAMPHAEACARIATLEKEHAKRRASVWAALGAAPLAIALKPLSRLASLSLKPVSGASAESAAAEYAENGWRCDRALLDALSSPAPPADHDLVAKVARNLYEPWADASARNLQASIAIRKRDAQVKEASDEGGTCILFVDGLRYDLGVTLTEKLEGRGLNARRRHRIAPLPTVTPTGKPETTPIRHAIRAGDDGADFTPVFMSSGEPVIAPKLRDAMRANGNAVLDAADPAGPESDSSMAWIEVGQLDSKGYDLGVDLVKHIDEELERIADQTTRLTELGWRVKIVTDHGWLLLPGGLHLWTVR